jgi:hypothetical protein
MRLERKRSRSSSGRVNAAVLPDPVTAEPTTSRPRRASGMQAAWMGVGVVYPRVEQALRSGRERPRFANVLAEKVVVAGAAE